MTQYRKKPVVISAITFAELVAHGTEQLKALGRGSDIVNGMPWAFKYAGHPITHETDTCYIIPTLEGSMHIGPDDMLITGVAGEIYPCKRAIFDATYELVGLVHASDCATHNEPAMPAGPCDCGNLPPHQQRVLDEKQELDIRITKLDEFITRNPLFAKLPGDEQARMKRQLDVQRELSTILGERIAHF